MHYQRVDRTLKSYARSPRRQYFQVTNKTKWKPNHIKETHATWNAVKVRFARHSFLLNCDGDAWSRHCCRKIKNLHSIVLPAVHLAMHPFPANGLEQKRHMVRPIKKNFKNILHHFSLVGQSENLASWLQGLRIHWAKAPCTADLDQSVGRQYHGEQTQEARQQELAL